MPIFEPKNKKEFDEILLLASKRLVVVEFHATWCGPCKIMSPKFHKLSEEFTRMVSIKVDTDELTDVSEMFNIQLMPSFIFIKNGKQVDRLESSKENELRKMIEARV